MSEGWDWKVREGGGGLARANLLTYSVLPQDIFINLSVHVCACAQNVCVCLCEPGPKGSRRRPLELGPAEKTNGLDSPLVFSPHPIFISFSSTMGI